MQEKNLLGLIRLKKRKKRKKQKIKKGIEEEFSEWIWLAWSTHIHNIVGNSPSPPGTFGKLSHLGEGYKTFCQKGGINLKTGGWCRYDGGGGYHFFITLRFNHIYCVWGKVRYPLLLFGSSVFWVSHSRFSSKSLLY